MCWVSNFYFLTRRHSNDFPFAKDEKRYVSKKGRSQMRGNTAFLNFFCLHIFFHFPVSFAQISLDIFQRKQLIFFFCVCEMLKNNFDTSSLSSEISLSLHHKNELKFDDNLYRVYQGFRQVKVARLLFLCHFVTMSLLKGAGIGFEAISWLL